MLIFRQYHRIYIRLDFYHAILMACEEEWIVENFRFVFTHNYQGK